MELTLTADWITAIGTLALATVTVRATVITRRTLRADRLRDDARHQQDREREERRLQQDRERGEQLRREAEEKWERRNRAERHQREDDDAQQNVIVEFVPLEPVSQPGSGAGMTHRIIVTTNSAYPIKWLEARLTHSSNAGIGLVGTGWAFDQPVTAGAQVRYTCNATVGPLLLDCSPIVRFIDRNGNQFCSYRGYTRRFPRGTEFIAAVNELDRWFRTGSGPEAPS